MRRFFLYLSIGVTLGVVSILVRAFAARESVLTSPGGPPAQVKVANQSLTQESANEAFGKTLQEEWPVDVTLSCLLALGLGKLGESLIASRVRRLDRAS